MTNPNSLNIDAFNLYQLANAFRETRGEEQPRLDYSVHGPFYDEILGDRARPRMSYVFGTAGSGKTSYHRLILQNYLPQARDSHVLGVNYLEARIVREIFSAELRGATMDLHWKLLFQTILSTLLRELLTSDRLEKLSPLRRKYLVILFQTYLPALRNALSLANYLSDWGYAALARALEMDETPQDAPTQRQWEMLQELCQPTPVELPPAPINRLIGLTDALGLMGINQVGILIDGLDEFVEEGNWEAAAQFLLPLCENSTMLSKHSLVFKFFLPQSLAELLEERGIRLEPRFDLHWSDAQLAELLRRRLVIESGGKIVALKEFAVDTPVLPAAKKPKIANSSTKKRKHPTSEKPREKPPFTKRLDEDLIANAYGSPRRLMRLCQLLFEALRGRGASADFFVEQDLEWAVDQYDSRYGSSTPLVIDAGQQRALIGMRELKLSASDFKCLLFLAEAEGRLRTKNEIWLVLWGEEQAVGDEAIDTFMSRLRKKLERGSLYLITERGKGYRLDNFKLVNG